jgi:hypothetical protein
LSSAQAVVKAEEQEKVKKQLARVRGEIRKAHSDYERLRREIKSGEIQVAVQQSHVEGLTNRISDHMQARPACAEFLPDDPEVVAWQIKYNDLIQRREQAIARRNVLQAEIPNKLAAARYEGNFGVIAILQRTENNLVRRLRNEPIGQGWQGGVYRVL